MDQIENDRRNETIVYNNNGLDIYSNATNVIQEQPSLNVPYDGVNYACNYTNNFVASVTVIQ